MSDKIAFDGSFVKDFAVQNVVENEVICVNMYVRNKLFNTYCMIGAEELPSLEGEIYGLTSIQTTVIEDYEVSLEDGWPDFIKDFYE